MQAKTLNIPSYIEDPSYRYKMPGLVLKIEGRGNGIKTKIVNLIEVATALRVPPAYPLKFLGYELGSQTNEGQSVVNGSFAEPEMRKHLDKFIEKYVLCTSCKYPEMVLKIKHGAVVGQCNSCGTRSAIDNVHKLAAYILKNPPKNASEFNKEAKDAKDAKDAKEAKDAKDAKDAKEKDGKKEEKKTEKDDKKGAKHEKDGHEKKDGHDKKEERKIDNEGKVKEPVVVTLTFKDLEEDLINKMRQVYQHHPNVEKPEDIEKIIKGATELVPVEHKNKIPYVIFNAVFDVNIAKEITKKKALLNQIYDELGLGDREFDLLLNLQRFLLVKHIEQPFEKYIPTILKFFYEEDLLTEEFLIDWDKGKYNPKLIMDFRYQRSVDDKFRILSKPILDWLKAEEGEEGEGEDGEGSDIDIDNI